MRNLTFALLSLLAILLVMLGVAACDIFVQDRPDTVVVSEPSPDVVVVEDHTSSPPPPPDVNITVEGDKAPPAPPAPEPPPGS